METSTLFSLQGDSFILQNQIFPPIHLNNTHSSLGLLYFVSDNTLYNITKNNSLIGISLHRDNPAALYPSVKHNFIEHIPPGIYNFIHVKEAVSNAIDRCIEKWSDYNKEETEAQIILDKFYFHQLLTRTEFEYDPISYKWKFHSSSPDMCLFFPDEDSLAPLLGIPPTLYNLHLYDTTKPEIVSQLKPVNIAIITSLHIHCNLVGSSYINGKTSHLLYSVPITVSPGYKIFDAPKDIVYLPITETIIDYIEIRITDQNGRDIETDATSVTVVLVMKTQSKK